MTVMHEAFLELRSAFPDLDAEVRSILLARSQEGATISDLKDDYRKNTGIVFPIFQNITEFLLSIPFVTAFCNENVQQQKPQQQIHTQKQQQFVHYNDQNRFEPFVNNISSKKNKRDEFWYRHNKQIDYRNNNEYINKNNIDNNKISESVKTDALKTKVGLDNLASLQTNAQKGVSNYTEETGSNNYYQDNCNHLSIQQQNYLNMNIREKQPNPFKQPMAKYILPSTSRPTSPSCTKSSRYNDSIYTTDSDYEAHLLDFPLLGDDFFLFLARMELRCKFKKYDKVLQSGLCVSGQTICGAIRRVRQLEDQCKSVIVNIGSVDIMKGRPLVQIEHDFRELINLMFKKGFTPILTTLAPLANFAHDEITKTKLERFNNFIKKEGEFLLVMDIWACLVNERGHILFDCFQNEPRIVTGTSEPYVFWNKIGRQRVLQLIESQLEY
nr:maternal effect protein oskar isoform X6 [Bactrocera oleae]